MKKHILGVMVLASLVFGSCGRQQAYIGADQAKQLALDTCSKTVEETDSVIADLVRRNDKDYYQVDIMAEGQHYQIEIDAVVGAVTEVKVSAEVQAGDGEGNRQEDGADAGRAAPGQPISAEGNHAEGQSMSEPAAGSREDTGSAAGMITLEEAKEKVLAHAGLTADQVTFVESSMEDEKGRQVYELEFFTSDFREYDYEVDAYSGEITGFDYDAEHYVPSQASGEEITAEDVRALALSKIPGAVDSDIRELEVEYEDGRTEYEGKIIYNGREYEFEIDSIGRILSWEEEPVEGKNR